MSSQTRFKETDLLRALASVVNGLVDKTVESRIDFMQTQRQAERERKLDPKSQPNPALLEAHGRLAAGYFALAVEVQAAMGSLAVLEGKDTSETAFRHLSPMTRLQLTALAAERGFTVDSSVLNAIPYVAANPKDGNFPAFAKKKPYLNHS